MQVRPTSSPRRSHQSDAIAGTHFLPRLYRDLTQMQIHGEQTVAVVDEDAVAAEEVLLGERHHSGRRRQHRRAAVGAVVLSAVRAARLAVEDASLAEAALRLQARQRRLDRQLEVRRPFACPQRVDAGALALGAREVRRRQLDVLVGGECHVLHGVGIVADLDRRAIHLTGAQALDRHLAGAL